MNSKDLKVIGFDVITDLVNEDEVDTERFFEAAKVAVMMVEAAEAKELNEAFFQPKQPEFVVNEVPKETPEEVPEGEIELTEEEKSSIEALADRVCGEEKPSKKRGRPKKAV